MRGFAAITILILLASVQCISACTLAACAEVQTSQTPPCHQHQKPSHPIPADEHAKACDHQKTADEVRPVAPDGNFVAVVANPPALTLDFDSQPADFVAQFAASPPASPPPFAVLRI